MHVREVPQIIFKEIVPKPKTVNVRQYFNDKYPDSIIANQYNDRPGNDNRVLGESREGCWLWLIDSSASTSLSVHGSLEGLLTEEHNDEFGRLVAGERRTGTWAYGSGDQYDQTLWMKTNYETFAGSEKLSQCGAAFSLLGNIALRAHQLIESGLVDVSRFFESDLSLEAQGKHGARAGEVVTRAFRNALEQLNQ